MKSFFSLLTALVIALTGGSAGWAAPNTASGNYRVDAVMTEGGALLEGAAEVYVLDRQGDLVARRHAVPAVVDLGGGDFTAAVVYGNAQARGALEPGTKAGSNVLNLEAGEVRLELVARDGTRDQAAEVSWTVYRYRPGAQRGPRVVLTDAARPELTLDAGWYEVRARLARKSDPSSIRAHVVEVKAGREQAYRIYID